MGFFNWFQYKLGVALINYGKMLGTQEAAAAAAAAAAGGGGGRRSSGGGGVNCSHATPRECPARPSFEPRPAGRKRSQSLGANRRIRGDHKLVTIEGGRQRRCAVCLAWGLGRKDVTKECAECGAALCKDHRVTDERFGTEDDPYWNHALPGGGTARPKPPNTV